jgi:hypothetical protein
MAVEPVVVMVAMVMAMMATFAAALASESNAGSEYDQGGSDTKSSLAEHSFSPVTQPVRYQSRPNRKGFTGNKLTERHAGYGPNYLEEAAAIETFFRPVSGRSFAENWCRARESNPRPTVYKTAALPLS